MKTILKSILLIAMCFITACGNDDDISFITITPLAVDFIDLQGNAIESGQCINPNQGYAVKVSVTLEGTGVINPTDVFISVNGENFTTTFTDQTDKIIPVNLRFGENVVEIIDTFKTDIIFVTEPILADFEEVL